MANEGAFRGVTDCHVHNDQSPCQNFVGLFKRPNEHEAVPAVLMISETSPSCSMACCVTSADYLHRPMSPY